MASPYMDGVRRALPIVLGYVPVAFAFGVLAVKSNIPPALVVAMSVFHFAGSGQFVCAGLWGAGVGAMSVIVAVFVVNLRHLLMSAAMAEPLAPLKRWQRFLFGCEMTDETFGVHITAFQRGWKLCTATLFTCNLTAHASWVLGTVIGVFCGGLVHDVKPLGLDYALTAMFLALLEDDLYFKMARHANEMAARLQNGLKEMGWQIWVESPTNQIFVVVPNDIKPRIDAVCEYEDWCIYDENHTVVRFVTCFQTSEADVDGLLSELKKL